MSSAKLLSIPPPTYSRLFRPWDGRTQQDNTITSPVSVEQPCQSPHSPSDIKCDFAKILATPIASLMETPKKPSSMEAAARKIKIEEPAPITILTPEKIAKQHLQSSPATTMDYMQTSPFLPVTPYNDFLMANAAAAAGHPAPFLGMDPFLGNMEQEYARVLAEEAQMKMMTARKQRPKKFKCPHCDVAFSNNGQLKGHIRIHTGERPFKCDEANCGKTFTRNEELTRHKRIHSGLRPFPCSTCGKRFGRRDHLKKHTR